MRWVWGTLLVLVLGGCENRPIALPVARPMSPVLTLRVNGQIRCTCTPATDGCYTAKHCFDALPRGAQFTLNGQPVTRYSLDPTRDLAHIPMGADPTVVLDVAVDGQEGVWQGAVSGGGIARLIGPQVVMGPYTYPWLHLTVQRQPMDVWLVARETFPSSFNVNDQGPVRPGDSGGGFYIDGRLVGILALTGGYSADTVRVP